MPRHSGGFGRPFLMRLPTMKRMSVPDSMNISLSSGSVITAIIANRLPRTCKNATFFVDLSPLTP